MSRGKRGVLSIKSGGVERSRAVVNSQDFGNVVTETVNNPIITKNDFTNFWLILLWDHSTRFWETLQSLHGGQYIEHEQTGVVVGIPRDELRGGFQIAKSLRRPPYFSHLAIFSFTWA